MSYVPEVKCPFENTRCLCQWCEDQCNNGLTCHECDMKKQGVHDIYMCTGFEGMYPFGTHSDEIRRKAEAALEKGTEV